MKAIVGSTWFTRGGVTESEHRLEGVLLGPGERPRPGENATGDRLVCLRSTAKPFQALVALQAGAAERFGLTPEHIGAACGTHTATDRHTSLVRSLLARIGCREEELGCGYLPSGGVPSKAAHFCSGNHAIVLAHCRAAGWSMERYLEPDPPTQAAFVSLITKVTGLRPDQIPVGIDSCSMPTYFLPLWACARLYGDLAAGRLGPAGCQVARAMRAHPELVGGEGCGDTELMRGQGGVTAKTGAEGLLVLGFEDGTGLALKAVDGAERAVDPLAIAVLRQELGLPCSTAALNRLASPTLHRALDGATVGLGHVRYDVN